MSLDAVVRAVVELVAAPLALQGTSADDHGATWSVLAQVAGAKLQVVASNAPTTFTPMTFPKPAVVELAGQDPLAVLREAARRLPVTAGHRAIPFVLLEGAKPLQRVCAVASPGAAVPVGIISGHRHDATSSLQAVVFDEVGFAVVGLDGHSARFGLVPTSGPLGTIERIDLDARAIGLRASGVELYWKVQVAPADEVERLAEFFAARGVPVRRMVQLDATTRGWREAPVA